MVYLNYSQILNVIVVFNVESVTDDITS